MKRIASALLLARAGLNRHRVQLGLALRVTVAAMLSLAFAQYAEMRLPLWAVLTAVVVTQVSLGRSLRATTDYLIGTVGGAVYGGTLAVLLPHQHEASLLAVLAAAVAPLALLATINPRLSVAPITAIIVLLVPTITHVTPLASAVDRLLEVAVGAMTGFLVSCVLLPSRAHAQVVDAAAHALEHMGRALSLLLMGLATGLDMAAAHRIQDGIGQSLVRLGAIGAEAEHERTAHFAARPDTGPLLRTLMRLRHDLVMIGRAALVPLPPELGVHLGGLLEKVARAVAEYFAHSGTALRSGQMPPPLEAVRAALDAFAAEITLLHGEGVTRSLAADAAERFFALGFALEQLRQNVGDLARCVGEWAEDGARRS